MIETKTYNGKIEVYRYLLTILVALLHFNPHGIFKGGYVAVDFFFMLSGFYLMKTWEKKKPEAIRFVFGKYSRFFWVYVSSILLYDLYVFKEGLGDGLIKVLSSVPDMLCLQMTGIFTPSSNGVLWYISAMLIVSFFLISLLNLSKKWSVNLVFPVLMLIGYSAIQTLAGNLDVHTKMEGERIIMPGLIRGFGGMIIGIYIAQLTESAIIQGLTENSKKLFVSLVELVVLSVSVFLMLKHPHSSYDFIQLILFATLIIFANVGNSYWSKIWDRIGNWLIHSFGKEYTLALYCHSIVVSEVLRIVFHISPESPFAVYLYLLVWFIWSFVIIRFSRFITNNIRFKKVVNNDNKI